MKEENPDYDPEKGVEKEQAEPTNEDAEMVRSKAPAHWQTPYMSNNVFILLFDLINVWFDLI